MAYAYIARSLFKSDRLMFAMHLAHGMFPKKIPDNVKFSCLRIIVKLNRFSFFFSSCGKEWEHFIGLSVHDVKESRSFPSWINEERYYDVSAFKVIENMIELYYRFKILEQFFSIIFQSSFR